MLTMLGLLLSIMLVAQMQSPFVLSEGTCRTDEVLSELVSFGIPKAQIGEVWYNNNC